MDRNINTYEQLVMKYSLKHLHLHRFHHLVLHKTETKVTIITTRKINPLIIFDYYQLLSKMGKITVTRKHADNRQKDFFYRLHRTPSFCTTLIAHRIITRCMQDGNTHSTIRINCRTQIRSVILVTTVRNITKIDFHQKLVLYCDTTHANHTTFSSQSQL